METLSTAASAGPVAPPKLAPVSGVLSQGQGVIKPIACRPVVSSANTTPILGNRSLNSSGGGGGGGGGGGNSSGNNNNNQTSPGHQSAGRNSWGLYNSTSDLRRAPSPGSAHLSSPGANNRGHPQPHLQRFSWSKGPSGADLDMGNNSFGSRQQQHQVPASGNATPVGRKLSDLPPVQQKTAPSAAAGGVTSVNGAGSSSGSGTSGQVSSVSGRVADLSRRFGGSLSSVAAPPNSPTQARQPPAYRPPPSSARSSGKTNSSYSSSELHLDRMAFSCARPASNGSSMPQWALGGSEVNLSSINSVYRSTLPRHQPHDMDASLSKNSKGGLLLSAYDPLHSTNHAIMSCNGSRSSWAGLPSMASKGLLNTSTSSNGSSSTLLSASFDRRDDTATPVVEDGRIRSILSCMSHNSTSSNNNSMQRTRKQSAGSIDEDFDCCDGDDADNSAADGTPSPSDSGVVELEALLKEKDCEIALLRETLEQNEAVIFQVYQEKEKSWERELKKLRSVYEERMRSAQQQASQAERQLQTQTQQWQSDRKQLKQQVQQLKSQCEQVQGRLDETSWTLCQKSGEMALLKSQLKDAQMEQSQRCQEMAKLRAQFKEAQESAHAARQRLDQVLGSNQKQVDNRRSITSPVLSARKVNGETEPANSGNNVNEVQWLQRRLIELQQNIEAERQVWHEEKATVLVYQRHLQQQYVQAMKRNQQLEEALGLLGITGVPPGLGQQQKQQPPPMSSPKSNCSDPITIDLDSSSNSSSSAGETHC